MKAPNKTRDSQKLIHFLRSRLMGNSYSLNHPQDTKVTSKSFQTTNMSVMESSHFSDYSLKNKCDKYEHHLLDVEDLEKVYGVVRENLKMPRPTIILEQKESGKEFEEKVLNDPLYREKVLKIQREHARKLREAKKAKENLNKNLDKSILGTLESELRDVVDQSLSDKGSTEEKTPTNDENKTVLTLEAQQISKRVGQYNVDIARHAGHKISYQVYAYVEVPKSKPKQEIQDIDPDEDIVEKMKQKIEETKRLKSIPPEEENPFLKVTIKDHNPFKRESYYVPLKDGEIDIKARMQKKWNPPDWMKFSGRNARRTFGRPWLAYNNVIGECDNKLKTTKANNSFSEYKDENLLKNLNNLSVMSEYKNSSFEREFDISLKHPTLIPKKVKLETLAEKVEDRNKIFGKLKEEEKSNLKNVKEEVLKKINAYNKHSKLPKPYRSIEKPIQAHKNSTQKLGKVKGGKILQRDSHRTSQNNISDFANTSSEGLSPKDSVRGRNGANNDSVLMTDKDERYFHTFITQNQIDQSQKESPNKNDQLSVTGKSESYIKRDISLINTRGKSRTISRLPQQPGPSSQNTGRNSNGSQTKRKSVLSTLSSFTGELSENDKTENLEGTSALLQKGISKMTSTAERKARSVPMPCDEIEDRFNKTFNEFVKVKAQADHKFKVAVETLKKDRPILNRIRYDKYRVDKMLFSHIDRFRSEAENCRVKRYKNNEDQMTLYTELLDQIVNQELNDSKLMACYYFMNVFKEILERGDVLNKITLNQILNKIDDENSFSTTFLGVIFKIIEKLKIKAEEIENESLKSHLQKYIKMIQVKKQTQRGTPSV